MGSHAISTQADILDADYSLQILLGSSKFRDYDSAQLGKCPAILHGWFSSLNKAEPQEKVTSHIPGGTEQDRIASG